MQGLVRIVRGVHDFTYTLVVGPVIIMVFAHIILHDCRVSTNRRHIFNVIELG